MIDEISIQHKWNSTRWSVSIRGFDHDGARCIPI